MNNQTLGAWLTERGIILEESFVHALTGMAVNYQKQKGIRNLDEVYKLIGVRKQLVSYWRRNSTGLSADAESGYAPSSAGTQSAGTQTKNF